MLCVIPQVLEHIAEIASLRLPVVIFIQPELDALPEVQDAFSKLAPWLKHALPLNIADVRSLEWYKAVQDIRSKHILQSASSGVTSSLQAKHGMYNPIMMARLNWLKQAAELNVFGTEAFMWLDGM